MHGCCFHATTNLHMHLDDGLAAGLQSSVDGREVGDQVLLAHCLYHLAADHLVKAARLRWNLPVPSNNSMHYSCSCHTQGLCKAVLQG